MLQSTGSQRAGHDIVIEKQPQQQQCGVCSEVQEGGEAKAEGHLKTVSQEGSWAEVLGIKTIVLFSSLLYPMFKYDKHSVFANM